MSESEENVNNSTYSKKISPRIYLSWDLFKVLNHIKPEIDVEELIKKNIPSYEEMDEKTLYAKMSEIANDLPSENMDVKRIEKGIIETVKSAENMGEKQFERMKHLDKEALINIIREYHTTVKHLKRYAGFLDY